MEVHRVLGRGFAEVVYKDAIEFELQQRKINYEREKNLSIHYKEIILQRSFNADFLVYEKIILEAKAKSGVVEDDIGQIVNYLSATKLKIGLLVNFGEDSLKFKRIIR
ncbi:MAG: GxxExxY protein [Bacteroidetes bacterium]|nr:GxxExxY protein [Bacteroidota bacterium]